MWPGARDEEARRFAVRRLSQAIALAPLFRPAGIVLHGGYFDWLFDFQPEKWFAPARRSFGELAEAAEKAGTDLFVENVFDEIPDHLLRLREAVGSPRLHFCFDPGHATLFSRVPVQKWAEAFGEGIRLMHVHDNRGRRDDHLPVGEGTINFRGVLLAVRSTPGPAPILTVEPHRKEHFARSVAGLRGDPRYDSLNARPPPSRTRKSSASFSVSNDWTYFVRPVTWKRSRLIRFTSQNASRPCPSITFSTTPMTNEMPMLLTMRVCPKFSRRRRAPPSSLAPTTVSTSSPSVLFRYPPT